MVLQWPPSGVHIRVFSPGANCHCHIPGGSYSPVSVSLRGILHISPNKTRPYSSPTGAKWTTSPVYNGSLRTDTRFCRKESFPYKATVLAGSHVLSTIIVWPNQNKMGLNSLTAEPDYIRFLLFH